MSYKSAKLAREKRLSLSAWIDRVFTRGASVVRLCGDGKRNNWSVLFSEMFFVDCPCCLFWRGAFIGATATGVVAIIIGALFYV